MLFSVILVVMAVIFWILRVIVSFTASMDINFLIKPLNQTIELVLCFVTFICILLIYRRKIWAALIYLIAHWSYYGVYIYKILKSTEVLTKYDLFNVLICALGVLIPLIILMDIGLGESSKKTSYKTKKTDWFYQNEQFDRKFDERADRNQYKF